MTDAVADTAAPEPGLTRGDPLTPALFALAIFLSASLVFAVQPMITKLVLPTLGGSPSVWNTAMVFFQAALLAGYLYAHLLQRVRSIKAQVGIHLALLLLAASLLPLSINGALGDPNPAQPIVWLLGTLAISVGAPFAVLSATAPLLQAWFARVRAGHHDGQNPYVLYAASNLGSFLALISYPVVIEPLMTLSGQRYGWTGGYGAFIVLIAALAFVVWRRRAEGLAEAPVLPRSAPIPWLEKGRWVLLAAAPSSLMLGVTAHLTTDVASAPFLWVIPLALYLLTFVIAFQSRPWIPLWLTLTIQAALVAACLGLLPFKTGEWAVIFAIHIATFFFTTLMCHQLLAARRPASDRLTEFYLLMSLGGVVGGAFTALLAPVVFQTVIEYPLVLVLTALFRPWGKGRATSIEWMWLAPVVVICLGPPLAIQYVLHNPEALSIISVQDIEMIARFLYGGAAIAAFMIRDRALLFACAIAIVTLSSHQVVSRYDWLHTERSFFGVMRVAGFNDPQMGGNVHMLMHGTTLHGAQARNPEFACSPTLYYSRTGPIGQVTEAVQLRRWDSTIGVIGQGSGGMAAYVRPDDRMTFFEIDPMVDRLSRDPNWFSFINGCAQAPVDTVLGDARLTIEQQPDRQYDLLLVDAFSSDAIPTHLLTVEALQTYLNKVKENGVVVLHLSNRNLEITQPVIAAARRLGAPELHQLYGETNEGGEMADASAEVVILSPTEQGLAEFRSDPRWRTIGDTEVRPWTDDYVNLFGSLIREVQTR
ncbi:fused MFS/spermidine synthase [Brevundimonas sp.]|uniref:fused MFS/spermidine synthase n=1 Tax=Brevundimonas sp. TaxID=1871086 RepID=UPI0035AF5E74